MATIQERIDVLGKRYALKAREGRAKVDAIRRRMESLPADSEAQWDLRRQMDAALEDMRDCQAVADEARNGYVLAAPSFIRKGRFQFEDDGLDRETYLDAEAMGLVVWPDPENPGVAPAGG